MKNRKILTILTIFFAALTGVLAVFDGELTGIPLVLGAICFIGLIISLVAGAAKEKS